MKVIDRAGKGSEISAAENDTNLSSLSGINAPITATSHTIDVDDQNDTIEYSNALPIAVTLPSIASVSGSNIHTDDFTVTIKNIGAGLVTITRGSTDTFDDASTAQTLTQYESITLQTDSSLTKWNILNKSHTSVNLNTLDVTALGTVEASKAVTADSSKFVEGMARLEIDHTIPRIIFDETDAGADQRRWDFGASAEAFFGRVLDTADANSTPWISVQRSGTGAGITIDSIQFGAYLQALTTNADLDFQRNGTGDITVDTIPIYGMVILDDWTNALNTTAAVGTWTSISAGAPAGATKAIIRCWATVSDATSPAAGTSTETGYVRSAASTNAADATTTAATAVMTVDGSPASILAHDINTLTVNLDGSGEFEYQTFQSLISSVTGRFRIDLVGYYV